MDGQGRREGQVQLKMAQPLEAVRGPKFRTGRVIADRTPVIGGEAKGGLLRDIVGNQLIIGIRKGVGMDPGEVGNIEKSLDLAAGKAIDLKSGQLICWKPSSSQWGRVGNGIGFSASKARQVQISP
jgi:hypothetical protein